MFFKNLSILLTKSNTKTPVRRDTLSLKELITPILMIWSCFQTYQVLYPKWLMWSNRQYIIDYQPSSILHPQANGPKYAAMAMSNCYPLMNKWGNLLQFG